MRSRLPKVLHPLCGRPMLGYVLDVARAATGSRPVVVVSPATELIREVIGDAAEYALQDVPRGTADAVRAGLTAVPEDVTEVDEAGASGIGLFRTEFLFMNRDTLPNEEEQFDAYRNVVESMRGRSNRWIRTSPANVSTKVRPAWHASKIRSSALPHGGRRMDIFPGFMSTRIFRDRESARNCSMKR